MDPYGTVTQNVQIKSNGPVAICILSETSDSSMRITTEQRKVILTQRETFEHILTLTRNILEKQST